MKVKALYRDPKTSPFAPKTWTPVKKVEVPDGTSKEELEKMAKEGSEGLELVEVVMEDGSPIPA